MFKGGSDAAGTSVSTDCCFALRRLRPFNNPAFSGVASYYGKHLQGHRMANGRRYNRQALTAATRRLPLGSHARVTSLRTHRSVKVMVTDRGPFKKHRVIDLSEAAARRLGMMHRGIDRVRVVPMK